MVIYTLCFSCRKLYGYTTHCVFHVGSYMVIYTLCFSCRKLSGYMVIYTLCFSCRKLYGYIHTVFFMGRRKRYRKIFCVQGGTPHSSL